MPFPTDDVVLQNLTVTDQLTIGATGSIESENFADGVSGFQLDGATGAARLNQLIVGAGDPRIEVVPDYAGSGSPAVVFYPNGGGAPTVLTLVGGTTVALSEPGGNGIVVGTEALEVTSLGTAGLAPGFRLAADIVHLTNPAAPVALVGGAAFDLVTKIETQATSPGGNLDATAAAFAAWSPTINVTCPPWATRAHVNWTASAIDITGIGTWELRCRLGGVNGRTKLTTPPGMADYSLQDAFTGLAPGAMTIEVQARRTVGASALRATVNSDFTYQITWAP